jgi:hypothetical protein
MSVISKEFLDKQLKKKKVAYPKGTTGYVFMESALKTSKCPDLSKLTKSVYTACKCSYFRYFIYFVGCVMCRCYMSHLLIYYMSCCVCDCVCECSSSVSSPRMSWFSVGGLKGMNRTSLK